MSVPATMTSTTEEPAVVPADETGDDEPDAEVMRRHFAVARRAFDPDHHIDAALDVFLTPRVSRPPSGQEPPLPS